MKIAVIGAGAIGGLVAGYLKAGGHDVTLVARAPAVKAIRDKGLRISGVRGPRRIELEAAERLTSAPELAIAATKTQDLASAIEENKSFLEKRPFLTTQNGVRADEIAAGLLGKQDIVSSIVMFGATSLEPGVVVHNFEGAWLIGRPFGETDGLTAELSAVLDVVAPTLVSPDLAGMKYLKVFVNASNCLPALLGTSIQETFSDVRISAISIAVWKEGLEAVRKAGITLASLPDFPLERITKLTALPSAEAARIFSGIMTGLSKEPLYGSVLQSLKRGKRSEIDYINGEFVNLARQAGVSAPLNEKLVGMVHRVEQTNEFFTAEEVLENVKGLVN
ncbi:MAG: 2-dehydropantoate 2-reductase [Candidatus Omnitrophica bacterium]|nr:2-dehydropantoate 2-reductase [Candidatus Omnitrophota bacterium]